MRLVDCSPQNAVMVASTRVNTDTLEMKLFTSSFDAIGLFLPRTVVVDPSG